MVHVYETPGTYIAICTLKVQSAISGVLLDSLVATKEITVNEPGDTSSPEVSIDVDPDSGQAPLEVYFTGNVTGGDAPFVYLWDFDDTGTSTSQNPVHTFTNAGTYNVTFTVTDNDGDTDSGQRIIEAIFSAGQMRDFKLGNSR
jgi:PKD repeat protein